MKQIREFHDQTEGLMAKEFLEAQGIPSELRGAREYASVVLGGTVGHYSLLVPEEHAAEAHLLLRKSEVQPLSEHTQPTQLVDVTWRKAVMWAVIAIVILPVVGNVISMREAWKYMRLERPSRAKSIWLFIIAWLQVPGIVVGLMLLRWWWPGEGLVF